MGGFSRNINKRGLPIGTDLYSMLTALTLNSDCFLRIFLSRLINLDSICLNLKLSVLEIWF